MVRFGQGCFALSSVCWLTIAIVRAENFSVDAQPATKFGVHEIVLSGNGSVEKAFDKQASVKFTPPTGELHAKTVHAFYDGNNTWRARVYVSQVGRWRWTSSCANDAALDGRSGAFDAADSSLRGRLLRHPNNPRQWITEDGRWFLNLSDTAYFLLCAHDGNGEPVTDDQARRYVHDDASRGITSLRCFLASRREGFSETPGQWNAWHFDAGSFDRLRLETMQTADHRLQMLLDEFPHIAVQLILFPLEGYGRDDRTWTGLSVTQRERLLRNLVARFAAYPQIYWLITNDAHYGDKFPNNNSMVREVGNYLHKHDEWQHPRSTGHARRLPFHFGGESWVDYVHVEHEHDLGALQYGQYHSLAKPVFLGEDRYEQDRGSKLDPTNMRYWQRRLFWTWLLSGGFANYGGRWSTVHPYSETGIRTAVYLKRSDVVFDKPLTGLDSVQAIKEYFEQRNVELGGFEPAHVLVEDQDGRTGVQAPRLMQRGKDEFLIYHPHAELDGQAACVDDDRPARIRLNLLDTSGSFSVEWFRAEDGRIQTGERINGGDWCELTAPWKGADVVVRLLRNL